MNRALRRLSALVMAMIIALVASTTFVQYVSANDLNNNPRNVRRIYREYGQHRGPIVAGGETLAESVAVDSPFAFQRVYLGGDGEQAEIFAPITGFFSIANGTGMLENAENSYLSGRADALWMTRIQDMFLGREAIGSSVETTIDPGVQRAAWAALGGQRGAIVAIEPATGRILAMVSKPSYDPNLLAILSTSQASANFTELVNAPYDPLINRAIGALYPPGSTFKLIDAAAALETGFIQPEALIPAPHRYMLPGTTHEMRNFGDRICSPTNEMTLHDAMVISCNTAFAELAVDLGQEVLRTQAQRFGFDESFDIPMRTVVSRFPEAAGFTPDRVALAGIGQGDVTATPLQMAAVAAAIANDGVLMQPYLVDRIRNAQLDVIREGSPRPLRTTMQPETALLLTEMMVDAVESPGGTAPQARIPNIRVAAKTGTAESADGAAPHAWITGFAPADDPQVAIAVLVENGGNLALDATGGAVAAPIFRMVLEAVLSR